MKKTLLLFPLLLLVHPLNITKIWIDFDMKHVRLRFVTFNILTKKLQKYRLFSSQILHYWIFQRLQGVFL